MKQGKLLQINSERRKQKMPSQYRNKAYATEPKFTKSIVAGYAAAQLTEYEVTSYIDRVIRSCEKSFPADLKYDGCRRMRPQEVYRYFSQRKITDNSRKWDFARTDVYMMEYRFSYQGQPLGPYHLFLPFTDDCGLTHIIGKPFYNKPVVKDSVLQVTNNQIFLQFISTPCTFNRLYYTVLKNENWEIVSIYHGCSHNVLRQVQRKKNKASGARIALNAHYLFIKYGFKEAFQKFCGVNVYAGTRDELAEQGISHKDYFIYSTRGTKPAWFPKDVVYIPHDMRIAVRKEDWTQTIESMIAAAIYIFDSFPTEVNSTDINDTIWWSLMLGKIIFGEGQLNSQLVSKITEHIKASDNYVDEMTIENFEQNGIRIENMYDFLFYLIENYDNIVHDRSNSPSSLVGRNLTVKRYVLSQIISNLFIVTFKIAEIKPIKLNAKRINDLFVRFLRPKLIFSNNSGRPYCVSISSPCDVRIFGITSEVLPQDNASGKKQQKNKSDLLNPRWQLDPSFMTIGSAFAQSKGEPIGIDKINPFVEIDELGVLHHQEVFKDVVTRITKVLSSKV